MFIINMHISFKYIEKVLNKFDHINYKSSFYIHYYVMTCIKPNITYVDGRLNRYTSNTSRYTNSS